MKISCFGIRVLSVAVLLVLGSGIARGGEAATAGPAPQPLSSTVVSLDGDRWLLATDPKNVGREEKWFEAPRPEAKPTKVPWIIQDAFPGLSRRGVVLAGVCRTGESARRRARICCGSGRWTIWRRSG